MAMADRAVRYLMASGLVPAAVLAVLVVTACSSGDDSASPEGSAGVEAATETSIAFGDEPDGEPSEDEAAGNVGADTDEAGGSDETESTSASGPGTEDDDVAAIEAEVERVIQRNWEIWVECTTDVETCEPGTALAETESTTSQFYMESVGVVELWKQQGIAYRAVEGRPVDRFVEIQSIDVSPDLQSAEVVLCDRDDRARFERNGEGEYEMVQGTDIGEDLLLRRVLAPVDGGWKIVENELLDRRHVEPGIDPLC